VATVVACLRVQQRFDFFLSAPAVKLPLWNLLHRVELASVAVAASKHVPESTITETVALFIKLYLPSAYFA
jgi:hypothetical protein